MSTISAQLSNFKEPVDNQPLLFFAISPGHAKSHGVSQNNTEDGLHKMDILCRAWPLRAQKARTYYTTMATRSRDVDGGIQAGKLHLSPPYLAFTLTERVPDHTTYGTGVDWLITCAGVYALSLST